MTSVSSLPGDPAPRIAALSVLPAFFDLSGARAVVAGGSEAAAWKAELLAAAGAQVHVYATAGHLSDSMAALQKREPFMKIHRRGWDRNCLSGAVIALADAEDEAEAAAFQAAAHKEGAVWNVIDKPTYCRFQFGAIVNRSPVVVGISTSAAAPILGQAVRRRIEALLPQSLAHWGELARKLRDAVTQRLAAGEARRSFWERFADQAFGAAPSGETLKELSGGISQAVQPAQGRIIFVGAGPGDPELLTLRAVRALQEADVILFDDLVSDEILELARREAKRILVGKRAGRPSCKQHEINEMMIALAKAGRRVVRLKSGDPTIFGRLGEEIAMLEQEGIEYIVVPGITAGLAMAAQLGVSLTHRDCAKSVRFITGHSRHGGLPHDLDWAAVADTSATTIFYMGGHTSAEISAALIERGMPHDTPAVVGTNIGRSGEEIHLTDLRRLSDLRAVAWEGKPVLIGIGRVFAQKLGPVEGCNSSAEPGRQLRPLAKAQP